MRNILLTTNHNTLRKVMHAFLETLRNHYKHNNPSIQTKDSMTHNNQMKIRLIPSNQGKLCIIPR